MVAMSSTGYQQKAKASRETADAYPEDDLVTQLNDGSWAFAHKDGTLYA